MVLVLLFLWGQSSLWGKGGVDLYWKQWACHQGRGDTVREATVCGGVCVGSGPGRGLVSELRYCVWESAAIWPLTHEELERSKVELFKVTCIGVYRCTDIEENEREREEDLPSSTSKAVLDIEQQWNLNKEFSKNPILRNEFSRMFS